LEGAPKKAEKITSLNEIEVKRMEKERVGLFFEHNMQLGPPYHIIIDTNFINFSIQYKLDIFQSMMDCLLAKCIPCVTDCVVAELEKMGQKYRLALK
jgi:U3 small nucleolar RNA-associated protein 24